MLFLSKNFKFNLIKEITYIQEGRIFRSLAIIVAVLLVITTIFLDIEYTFVLFSLFALFLFLYHYKATEKFNAIYLIHVTALVITNMVFLYDFELYINGVSFLHIISQLCFIWLLRPVLKGKLKNFGTHNLVEIIIGFIGLSYIIGYLFYLIFPLIPDLTLFLPSVIAFLVMVIVCIGIPIFNKHPDNILLWGVGGGLIAEMSCAFIFEYISSLRVFLVMAHIFGAFLQIIFVIYLTRIKHIKSLDEDYV